MFFVEGSIIHQEAIKEQLIDNVEVDEAYFGATRQ